MLSTEQRVGRLIGIAECIRSVKALVVGASTISMQIEAPEADAIHEILKEVEDRLICVAADIGEAQKEPAA